MQRPMEKIKKIAIDLSVFLYVLFLVMLFCVATYKFLHIAFPKTDLLKKMADLSQIVGGWATAFTLLYLIVDKRRELNSLKNQTLEKQLFSEVEKLDGYVIVNSQIQFDRFLGHVNSLNEARRMYYENLEIAKIEKTDAYLKELILQISNNINLLDLFGYITCSRVRIPVELLECAVNETKKWVKENNFTGIVSYEIEPFFYRTLAIIGLARAYGDGGMSQSYLVMFKHQFVLLLCKVDKHFKDKVSSISSDSGKLTDSYEYQLADILKVHKAEVLSGMSLAAISKFHEFRVESKDILSELGALKE